MMSALSGIDIALWDMKARKLNVPIYQLLGGKVRDTIKVYAWIGGDRPADVEIQASVLMFYPVGAQSGANDCIVRADKLKASWRSR